MKSNLRAIEPNHAINTFRRDSAFLHEASKKGNFWLQHVANARTAPTLGTHPGLKTRYVAFGHELPVAVTLQFADRSPFQANPSTSGWQKIG